MEDLPYRAEYAKSSRAGCRGCKTTIGQGDLRLAVMVQSPVFDGKTPQWYHFKCFFQKQRPKSTDDIHHFESLRIEDQKRIRDNISNAAGIILPDAKGKGKKRANAAKQAALKDYKIEYSKSSRAMCRGCEQKIMKEEIRISKKDYTTEVGMKYGGQDLWHHLGCFAKLRSELGYFESADKLPGFSSLSKGDQAEAKKVLPAIKQEEVPEAKKLKTEDVVDGLNEADSKLYEKQNKTMFKYRDQLQQNLTKPQLAELLEENDQEVPVGIDRMLDRLSDIMTFGALRPCPVCKNGQFVFDKYGYRCRGNYTEFTRCSNFVKVPERKPFVVPSHLAEEHSFLNKYKYTPQTRIVKEKPLGSDGDTKAVKKEEDETDSEPKVKRDLPALYDMEFVILGKPARGRDLLKKEITKLGGKVTTKITGSVMAIISTEAEVEKMNDRMRDARDVCVQVVPEEFVDQAKENAGKIPELIVKKSICDWGTDPNTRLPPEPSTSSGGLNGKSKSGKSKSGSSQYTSSMPSKVKLKLKGGGAVDPDSGLEDVAHVYKEGSEKYTTVLSKTDIQTNKNSYYKIQLLKADNGSRYWVFRAWGRIGTTIGGNKVEQFDSLHAAKANFCNNFLEKTGNEWSQRGDFQKHPGLFNPVDVDYGEEEAMTNMDIQDAPSKLSKPVQDLVRNLFDVNSMKKVMLEFELDTEKMPLGKLSKKQIQNAYKVLSELQNLCDKGGNDTQFVDASNRFYTFIPHSFGISDPPVLKTPEMIKQKLDMLDNLMELEVAYSLMKSSGSEHTVDSYYTQLNTEIEVLDKETEEFKIIEEYVTNTHAQTHSSYALKIMDVFTIKRSGEDKRFKPFKKLHNHKLLWHGSRTTNFAGILSQGLRIAPPEAPVTGYMFGKGIYFADMVSKSANYCCTSPMNSLGMLLLSDVALGDMYERTRAEYVQKLPKGKHSTKGVGRTQPDPQASKFLEKLEVPCGKPVTMDVNSALLYNEYIVYDVAQVNVKYLLKVDFQYKY